LFVVRLFYCEPFVQNNWIADHWTPSSKSIKLDIPYTMSMYRTSPKLVEDQNKVEQFSQFTEYESYQSFFEPVMKTLFRTTRNQVIDRRVLNIIRLQNAVHSTQQKIPNLIHCFWYSSHFNPDLLNRWRIFFGQHNNFKIICWFFGKEKKGLNQIQQIFVDNKHIVFLDILMYDVVQYAVDLFDIYYQYKKIHQWIELIAYNLIYKYGGIYVDVNHIPMHISPDLLYADYFAHQDKGIITTTFMASKPKSVVYHQCLLLLEDLYRYESFIQSLTLPSNWLNPWSSSLGMTLAMDQWLTINEIFVPLHQDDFSDSWTKTLIDTDTVHYTLTRKKLPTPGFYAQKYSDERMIKRFGTDIFKHFASVDGIPIEQYNKNRQRLEEAFFNNISNPQTNEDIIPRIIHRIWLTKNKELGTDQLECIKHAYDFLYPHWQFILWTNNISAIPQSIEYLRRNCPALQVQDIYQSNIKLGKRTRHIVDAFIQDRRFAHAKDILAVNIIYTYGGLCMDLGVVIKQDFTNIINAYDLAFYYFLEPTVNSPPDWYDAHIEIPIVGGKKNNNLFERWLNDLENAKYKQYDKTYFATPTNQLVFTATEYLSYLLNAYGSHNKVLFLPEHFYINLKSHSETWVDNLRMSKIDLWNF
jgi:mannosyltransferase OCH1-like enzyme